MIRLTAFVLALLGALPCFASSIEIVQSVPVETTLSVPGVRETRQVWLEMINSAQTSLDIEQFYISEQPGEALTAVLDAIGAAAQRGVRIRLVADSVYFKTYPETVARIGQLTNSEARIVDFHSHGGVMHAKYFVVDGREAFVGSQNFDWRALSHIHEVGVHIADADVMTSLEKIFETDWAAAVPVSQTYAPSTTSPLLFEPALQATTPDVFVVASPPPVNPPGVPSTLDAIVGLIDGAQSSVRIEVMEFTTSVYGQNGRRWTPLAEAIRGAAQRGVRVQMMVDVSDVKKARGDLQALSSLPNVELKIVTIPQWSGGPIDYARLIHSKYLVVDDTVAWVGSENWSAGYFLNTRNVGLVIHVQSAIGQLNAIFEQLWRSDYSLRFH